MDDRDLGDVLLPKLMQLDEEPIDPNTLAAYVAGTLPSEEHDELAARISRDPEAMMLVRAMEEDARSVNTRRWSVAALAASVLLAVGLWWGSPADDTLDDVDVDSRLLAAAERLGEREPELFGGFEPLTADALESEPAVTRGGATWLAPSGTLLQAPTTLRWKNAPDSTLVRVTLEGAAANWSEEVEGESVAAPPLAPGRYVVRLMPLDALGAQTTRAVFEIASADTRERLARADAALRAEVDDALADLLVAQHAVWAGYFGHARKAAELAAKREGAVAKHAARLLQHLDVVAPR